MVPNQDGYTHTEFCQHGSGDDVELMIRKAIKLGFKSYSVTEHAPLPPAFRAELGGALDTFDTGAMALTDVPAYLQKIHSLQHKYRHDLKINLGFEFDFLPTHIDWTRDFLEEYGAELNDGILSVHFMKGTNAKFYGVDYTPTEFQAGFRQETADAQSIYGHYLDALQQAVTTDLGPHAPKRLGHMTLIKKFQDYFQMPLVFDEHNMRKVRVLFNQLKRTNWALDFNVSGLYKPWCNEVYPYPELIKLAQSFGIPLIYGSDAHSIAEVGHGHHLIDFLNA
ncbi:histidinol-phosphatase HisJ [Agrilactobacillus fermenti]|uniref:histidinol-phosphatase HisJ n=1 Tax=Agrilactobacillus fermenti TaxID=2586909 RepID=UPI003A5BC3D8